MATADRVRQQAASYLMGVGGFKPARVSARLPFHKHLPVLLANPVDHRCTGVHFEGIQRPIGVSHQADPSSRSDENSHIRRRSTSPGNGFRGFKDPRRVVQEPVHAISYRTGGAEFEDNRERSYFKLKPPSTASTWPVVKFEAFRK
jgi:hypothetical protein